MLKNLLLIAVRNLKKDKWYSLINIVGLMIGITFSLFLILYIVDELSYDRYNTDAGRIYRVVSFIKEPERDMSHNASTQIPLVPELARDYPEVEQAVRLSKQGTILFANGEKQFYQDKVYAADSNVFKVFTWRFIEGSAGKALVEPNSIVLTQGAAEKYFGKSSSSIGKTLRNSNGTIFRVTAVIADVPDNSHLRFNALIPISSLGRNYEDNKSNWGGFGTYSYLLLRPGVNVAALEKRMLRLYDQFMAPDFAPYNIKIHYGLQPITAIHLHSDMGNEPEQLGSMSYIYILSAVAVFLLLIACINYMNLTTARSTRRAKEIGIRKVTGSSRWLLIAQFLVESILTALIACAFSLLLFSVLLPTFNLLSGKSIELSSLMQPARIMMLLGVVILVGLLGGAYPAFYLSRFNPVSVLKGSFSRGSGHTTLRRILVVTQFSISMCMLICTWVVHDQLQYLREKDLGFNKDQVMTLNINGNSNTGGRISSFVNELKKNPDFRAVSTSSSVPGSPNYGFWLLSIETKDGFTQKGVMFYAIDESYLNTLGMKIVAGRNFAGSPDTLRSIIVNEAMAREYGWDHPLGKKVKYPGDTSSFYFEVVGVVKDFNQSSLYNPIAPLILFYRPNSNGIEIKVGGQNIPAAIASVEKTWKTIFPELPFSYTFLDEDFDSQYAADQKRGKIFLVFSIITLSITCLGLLGLIAFITGQRQKEISIRKIMGAHAGQIAPLLFGNFILLVCISCLIAFPVAAMFMNKWLKLFFYSAGLKVQPFVFSAIAVLLVTTITVAFHTVKSAVASPIHGLRNE
jgi:putative ABC transport system permease protein